MQVDTVSDSLETSTSAGASTSATSSTTTRISVTKRKFDFISPFEFGVEYDGSERSGAIETCIKLCDMLSALVKGLACLQCMSPSLNVLATSHRLGVVCTYETWCTECNAVLYSTLSSDRLDGSTAGNPHLSWLARLLLSR